MRQPPVGHPAVTIAAAAAATTNRARTLRLAADYSQGGPAANAFFFFRRERAGTAAPNEQLRKADAHCKEVCTEAERRWSRW